MIIELRRELSNRNSLYPWLIKNKKMSVDDAVTYNTRMASTLRLLENIAQSTAIEIPLPTNKQFQSSKSAKRAAQDQKNYTIAIFGQ
jgi:hypothetical protein